MRSRLIVVFAVGMVCMLHPADTHSDTPINWRVNDAQTLDFYTTGDIPGTSDKIVPAGAVAELCGDFDGCTVRLYLRTYELTVAGSTVDVFPPTTVHLFTDDFALDWISWDQSGSVATAVSGTHGNLTPEAIAGFQNGGCFFRDDFIPPGTFDLSYGLSVADLSPSIHSYCRLRIED